MSLSSISPASIVSKKAAESLDALVLDVKVGRGAMMKTVEDSRSLASWLVGISKGLGIATRAVLTDMNNPLGLMIGNSLEVKESIYCMKGAGPHSVRMLTQVLGGHLLHILGKANSASAGAEAIGAVLDNGEALKIFRELMVQHGVDPNVATAICETPDNGILPRSKYTTPVRVKEDGHVAALDALECAHVSCSLGAGRRRAGDPVNHGVGLQLHMEVGDKMSAGDTWVTVHHDEPELDESLVQQLEATLTLSAEPVTVRPLVIEVIE